jgi:hypothetical protein
MIAARVSYRRFWSGRKVRTVAMPWRDALTVAWGIYRRRRYWERVEKLQTDLERIVFE